jgi:hypothetical protein
MSQSFESSIKHKKPIKGTKIEFNADLNYDTSFSKYAQGWNMEGFYRTDTDIYGESYLMLFGTLKAPYKLNPKNAHHVLFAAGNDKVTERFWSAYTPNYNQAG